MSSTQPDMKIARMLLDRLERIPVDSSWAHRASGVRGALLRMSEQMEMGDFVDPASWRSNTMIGFHILEAVARARSETQSQLHKGTKGY